MDGWIRIHQVSLGFLLAQEKFGYQKSPALPSCALLLPPAPAPPAPAPPVPPGTGAGSGGGDEARRRWGFPFSPILGVEKGPNSAKHLGSLEHHSRNDSFQMLIVSFHICLALVWTWYKIWGFDMDSIHVWLVWMEVLSTDESGIWIEWIWNDRMQIMIPFGAILWHAFQTSQIVVLWYHVLLCN